MKFQFIGNSSARKRNVIVKFGEPGKNTGGALKRVVGHFCPIEIMNWKVSKK
jgi:hypothetical protein